MNSSKKIKSIFWDNDGILVDTEMLYYRASREVFAKIGVELTIEMYIQNFLIRSKGMWHLAEKKGLSHDQITALRNERNSIYGSLLSEELRIIAGVKETLNELSGKYKMGVVTSSRGDHFKIIHEKSGLMKYFDFVITSDDYKEPKPDPEPYLMAVEKSGFKKEECAAVEDSERGLKAALAAGIKCYVIPTQLTEGCDFTGAEKVLSSIYELQDELN